MKRWSKIALAGTAALVAGVTLSKDYVLLHLPGWIAPSVGENRPVAWQQGPARPPAPVPGAQRPPNVVLIVADDLGYNDVSFGGGGVGQGTGAC